MRTTSSTLKAAIFGQETDQVFLFLLEISEAGIGPPTTLYFVNNYEDVSSGGNTYIAYPFSIDMPEDSEDRIPTLTLSIDNVDQSIIAELRTITGPPTVKLSVVLASDPNIIEAGPFEMTLHNVDYDAHTITGNLQSEDILNEAYPGDTFSPLNFPGLF